MAVRIPWDEYEAAILLDVCLAVIDNKISRADAVIKVSRILREKAIKNGYTIDSVFRNENGISMQMNIMIALILETSSGLHGASKLFIEIVQLYKNNPNKFEKILEEAKKDETIVSTNKMNFYEWLDISVHPSDVTYIKKACDLVDIYSKNNIKLGYSLFETNQLTDIQRVIKAIEKDVFFRAKNGRQIQRIDKALNEYSRFIRQCLSDDKETVMFEEKKEAEVNIVGVGAVVSDRDADLYEVQLRNVNR